MRRLPASAAASRLDTVGAGHREGRGPRSVAQSVLSCASCWEEGCAIMEAPEMIVSLFLRHGASCLVMENHKTKRMQISMDSGQNLKATAQRIKTNAGSTLEAVFNRQCVARQYIDRQ